jgi:oligosaccharide repeat unit polymerase
MINSFPDQYKNNKLVYLLFFILFLDAVIKFGRFPIIYIFFFLFYFRKRFNLNFFKFTIIFSTCLVVMVGVIWLRQFSFFNQSTVDFFTFEVFYKSFLSYNLIGFFILDDFIDRSLISVSPFNFSVFSPYFYYFEIFLGRFGFEISYPWKTVILDISTGRYIKELDLVANAFGTNFLPYYLDFGFFGPLFLGLFLGFFAIISSKGVVSNLVSCISIFIMIFGLYQSVIVSPIALSLFLPLLFSLVRIKYKK